MMVKALRGRCRADRAAYLETLADGVQANDTTSYQAVGKLLGKQRKKPWVLPAVRKMDGTLCESPRAVLSRWREHFSALEDGVETCGAALAHPEVDHDGAVWPTPPSIDSIPTPWELVKALLQAKRGKANGPDSIPGELGLEFPCAIQALLYPLVLKLGLLGEEGIGHKSGCLTWLWKGRGDQTDCASFRGILLLSNLCKAVHRAFRPRIQEHFQQHAVPLQLGGRKGGSVISVSHAMRTFMRIRAIQGCTSAVLFADVSAAYYSTVRELAARNPAETRQGPQGADDLSLEVQRCLPSGLEQAGADPWLSALTSTLNAGTWMYLQGDTVPVRTRRGTRPGSAWADLTFGVIIARILKVRDACNRVLPELARPRASRGTSSETGDRLHPPRHKSPSGT